MAKILTDKTGQGRLGYYHYRINDEATGIEKYAIRMFPAGKLDADYINEWAAVFTGTSEAQMEIAFAALAKAIQYFTLNGHSITLRDLGTFNFSTKSGIWDEQRQKWVSAGKENRESVSADDIRALYVRFRPCSKLRTAIGTSEFFNAVGTTIGWNKLTNYKAAPGTPSIEVNNMAQTFKVHAHYDDPPGTPLSYSLDLGVTWQAYTGPVYLENGGTVKARAVAGNGKPSEIATATVPHG